MSISRSLEGFWQPLYAELDTEEAPMEVLEQTEVELTAGHYVVRFGGQIADQGTYEAGPAGLTLRGIAGPNADRVIPCIFKFIDDTLMICYGLGSKRPTHFHTEVGAQLYLVTYRRKGKTEGVKS